ncbi:MAG: hypothetical protein WC342_01670 [Methanoregula sp.]|jgi:hypothetical protein
MIITVDIESPIIAPTTPIIPTKFLSTHLEINTISIEDRRETVNETNAKLLSVKKKIITDPNPAQNKKNPSV